MRLFRCILLYSAAVASLILCTVTAALWVRSYVRTDAFNHTEAWVVQTDRGPRNHISYRWVVSERGRLRRSRTDGYIESDGPTLRTPWHRSDDVPPGPGQPTLWTRVGLFASDTVEVAPTYRWSVREIGTPYWLPTFLVAGLALDFTRRARSLKRAVRESLCALCGYDLRATPDRCPECGTSPGKGTA